MIPSIEPGMQPIVVCKPGTVGVSMPSADEVVVKNLTDTTQPGQIMIVPAVAVAAMKIDLKSAAQLAGQHIRQFFKEIGF